MSKKNYKLGESVELTQVGATYLQERELPVGSTGVIVSLGGSYGGSYGVRFDDFTNYQDEPDEPDYHWIDQEDQLKPFEIPQKDVQAAIASILQRVNV